MRRQFLFGLILVVSCLSASAANWQKLEGCKLVADEYGDGDSFHVRQGDVDYIFRLYFVDTPETDSRFPERVADQARYFGITSAAALALGKKAEEFSFTTLAQPFTVWTKWQDARGASKQHRFYAAVETSAGSLSSLLVANGLARVFGMTTALPDKMKAKTYVAKLLQLEAQAKAARRGGWSGNAVRSNTSPEPTGNAADQIPAY